MNEGPAWEFATGNVLPFKGIRVDGTEARPLDNSADDTPWGWLDPEGLIHGPYLTQFDAQSAANAEKEARGVE